MLNDHHPAPWAGVRAVPGLARVPVLLFVLAAAPRLAPAQLAMGRPQPQIGLTVVGGAFGAGRDTDGFHPLVAARVSRTLGRGTLVEAGLGLTSAVRPITAVYTHPDGTPYDAVIPVKIPLLTPDLQLQAELPFGRFRPYAGAGGGLLIAFRGDYEGDRFIRPAAFGSVGVRADLGRHVGVRGEVRLRVDSYPGGDTVGSTEQTAGLSWRF